MRLFPIFLTAIMTLLMNIFAFAQMNNIKIIPNAKKIGEYSYSYFIWDIYNIALYAENNDASNGQNIALMLTYKRDLKGQDISARSISEIRNLGFKHEDILQSWQDKMDHIFPNVQDGTVLTGIRYSDKVVFYQNGREIGIIQDAEFSRYFFDIWLSPNTSEPDMRKALLGLDIE